MAKRTNFNAPADFTITNNSEKEIKIPVAGSPDRFIFIEAGKGAIVHVDSSSDYVFYDRLTEIYPITIS